MYLAGLGASCCTQAQTASPDWTTFNDAQGLPSGMYEEANSSNTCDICYGSLGPGQSDQPTQPGVTNGMVIGGVLVAGALIWLVLR